MKHLIIEPQQLTFGWKIVDGNTTLASGFETALRKIRDLQVDNCITRVFIDAGFRTAEVMAAAATYGWQAMKAGSALPPQRPPTDPRDMSPAERDRIAKEIADMPTPITDSEVEQVNRAGGHVNARFARHHERAAAYYRRECENWKRRAEVAEAALKATAESGTVTPCDFCNGTGTGGGGATCRKCGGSGKISTCITKVAE